MTIQGKTFSFSRSEEKAGLPGHGPVLLGIPLTANDGIYPVGLLLTRNSADVGRPLQEISAEVLGTGNGAATNFTGTLAAALPVQPGSIAITDGVETFVDDGSGRLKGSAGGSGTIDYRTGDFDVTFNAAVANATDVTGAYITALDAVLDGEFDTSAEGSGLAVIHGTVAKEVLKVGATAKAEPSTALLKAMRNNGIYPI